MFFVAVLCMCCEYIPQYTQYGLLFCIVTIKRRLIYTKHHLVTGIEVFVTSCIVRRPPPIKNKVCIHDPRSTMVCTQTVADFLVTAPSPPWRAVVAPRRFLLFCAVFLLFRAVLLLCCAVLRFCCSALCFCCAVLCVVLCCAEHCVCERE